jgi:hypothetical protein
MTFSHNTHYRSLEKILSCLSKYNIDTRLTQRYDYSNDDIEWSDCILTAGGDGYRILNEKKLD